jgi:Arc/MetJ-type ribon-helix-helix transcriptional regulator
MLTVSSGPPTLRFMEVHLTPDQQAFVRLGIESGRFHTEADAVAEALALWEERERARAEILAAVDTAEASLDNGEGIEITEQSTRELAERVKRRGRAQLEVERSAGRWHAFSAPKLKMSLTRSGVTSPARVPALKLPIVS